MPVIPAAPINAAARPRLLPLSMLLLALMLAIAAPAGAADTLDMTTEEEAQVTWNLKADKVNALGDSEVLEAFGNVELLREGDSLKADYARYYAPTKWVYLSGNVEVRMDGDVIKATEAEFDLSNSTGWLKNGEIFMEGPHAYFTGEHVDKHWGDVYTFNNAKITTCDGNSPAWSFFAEEAVVELDGYAQLWKTSFQIKDMPVLFSPFLVLPVRDERQSGFLMPDFGASSMRGFFYNQPYFWAIDESRDLTLNEYFMSKRGFMQGAEYRSRAAEDEYLWLRLDWMYDTMTVTNDNDDEYYRGDGLVRNNSSRYWLRGMYDARLPNAPNWQFRMDLDIASDQYFLREFDNSLSGFTRTRNSLFDAFTRDLREIDMNRVSSGMLFREWERASLYFSAQYTQNLTLGNGNAPRSGDTTVQQLPQLDLFLNKGRIFPNVPLEANASAQAVYMYRNSGTRGMRYDISPTLSLPLENKYGSLRVEAGLNQTFYQSEVGNPAVNQKVESGNSRTLGTFSAEASTEFARIYDLAGPESSSAFTETNKPGASRWSAVHHTIQPKMNYSNLPSVDQENNPSYDTYDRVLGINALTYTLDNTFARKRERVLARKDSNGKEEKYTQEDYLEVLRLRLAQTYDIKEANRDDDLERYERRPLHDLMAEATIGVDEYFSLVSRTYFSPYSNDINRHAHGININVPKWGNLYTGLDFIKELDTYYRQVPSDISLFRINANINLFGPWSTNVYYSWSFNGGAQEERGIDIIYTDQCYQIIGRVWRDELETSYQIFFSLNGLGSFGAN